MSKYKMLKDLWQIIVLRLICEITERTGEKNVKEHQIHKYHKIKKVPY